MRKILFLFTYLSIFLMVSCSSDDAPTSLSSTSWKYTYSSSTYQVLKFTSASGGTYSTTTSGATKSYSFTYTYASPDITIKVSNGTTFEGSFSSTSTLKVISSGAPTSALTFTKQ